MRGRGVREVTVASMGLALLVAVGPAGASEMKSSIGAALMLELTAPRADTRGDAFDEALREPGPAPRDATVGEVMPDGSVRYGKVTVSVRNPCPPGTFHDDEPPPLPGRRARR